MGQRLPFHILGAGIVAGMLIAIGSYVGFFNKSDTNPIKVVYQGDYEAEKINENEQFSIETIAQPTLKPTDVPPTPTPTPKIESGIFLKAVPTNDGVDLSWSLTGIDTPNGVKILKSTKANPTYPENAYVYLGDAKQKSYRWDIRDGQTWHFRVCRYVDDRCTNYSNNVSVQTVKKTEGGSGEVNSITLSLQKEGNKARLSWSVDGFSEQGYKVVWSKNENPTYPLRDGDTYHYESNPDKKDFEKDGFSGTYHFRVCEYLGGTCGKYSNDMSESF